MTAGSAVAVPSTFGLEGTSVIGLWGLVTWEEAISRSVSAFGAFVVYLALHPSPFASLS